MQISDWTRRLFASIDAMDAGAFAGFLAEDGVFLFANQPQVCGRAAAESAVAGFFAAIKGLRHELLKEWRDSESAVVEGRVTYTRKDGSSVTLPFVNVLELRGTAVARYKIYVDATPLFSPAA